MIRRCHTLPAAIALTALAVLGLAGSAHASGIANYQLVNTSAAGTPAIDQVVASILPAGSVPDGTNPNGPTGNPFSVIAGSSGFNAANLVDFLGSGTLSTGDPVEVIKLQFDGQGLAPGGVVNFSLALDPSYNGPPPTLVLAPGTTGLRMISYNPPPPSSGSGSGTDTGSGSGGTNTGGTGSNGGTQNGNGSGTVITPEPLSLAFWSIAASLGLLRARAFRRAQLKNL